MDKNIKKTLVFLIVLFAAITLSVSAYAVTIYETTDSNDGYDTIEEGTRIVGVTKFSNDTVLTAKRAAIAGANDMKVYVAKGGDTSTYTGPVMYYYLTTDDWYVINEDGSVDPIDAITGLDIYYVNNVPKTGLDSATGETITDPTVKPVEEKYTVTFMNGSCVFGEVQEVEKGETATKPETEPTKEGFEFVGWYKDNAEFDFTTAINEDTVVVAEFAKFYTIDSRHGLGGTVAITGDNVKDLGEEKFSAPAGTKVTLTFEPEEGMVVRNNSLVVKNASGEEIEVDTTDNSFTMPETDVTVNVEFVRSAAVIDKENDEAITDKAEKTMEAVEEGKDQNIMEIEYDEENNKLEVTINKNTENEVNLVEYAKQNIGLLATVTEDLATATYELEGTQYTISLDGSKSDEEVKGDIARMLLRLAGKEVPEGDRPAINAAKELTFADITGKELRLTTDFEADKTIDYTLTFTSADPESKKDEENDEAINSTVDTFMANVTDDDAVMEITYKEEDNEATVVIDEADETTPVTAYADDFSKIVLDVAKDAEEMKYTVNGVEYSVDLSTMDEDAAIREFAKLLLRLKGKTVNAEEAAKLKLGELVGETFTVTAKYNYGVILNYTVNFEEAKSKKDIDAENDTKLNERTETFMAAAEKSDGIPELKYDRTKNEVTVVVNEALQDSEKVVNYADTFVPMAMDVAEDAEEITYTVDGVEYSVDLSTMTEEAAKREVAKVVLRLLGKTVSEEEALKLKLSDVVGQTAVLNVNYGNNRVLEYTVTFDSVNYTEVADTANDAQILSTVAAFMEDVDENDGITEMKYDEETNKVTFVVNEARQEKVKVANYADTFLDLANTMMEGAKTLSYEVDGTPYVVDVSTADSTKLQKEFAKAILRMLGKDLTESEALALKLADVVGVAANVSIDYGDGVVLPYTVAFEN